MIQLKFNASFEKNQIKLPSFIFLAQHKNPSQHETVFTKNTCK
jgi:hypothetical protein